MFLRIQLNVNILYECGINVKQDDVMNQAGMATPSFSSEGAAAPN